MKKIPALFFLLPLSLLSFAQGQWDSVATNGFGNPSATQNYAIDSLNGEIYIASTSNTMGGNYMYRSASGAYGTWTSDVGYLAAVSPVVNGITSMRSTALGGGMLFAGSDMYPAAAQVFYTDGSIWTQYGTIPYVNNPQDYWSVTAMTIYNDSLYVAVENYTDGAEIWKTPCGSANWIQSLALASLGQKVEDMAVFGDTLYAITNNGLMIQSPDGMNWFQNTAVDTNFNDLNNYLHRMEVFNGSLFVGADNNVTGEQLWKTNDGVTWTLAVPDGFNNPGNVFRFGDIREAFGKLWVISEAYSPGGNLAEDPHTEGGSYWAYVHYSSDGVNWTMDVNNGFDTSQTAPFMWGSMCLLGFNNHVFAAGMNYAGAQVWSTCIALTAGIGPDVTTCADTLVLYSTVSGGVTPYDYLWSCGTTTDSAIYAPPTTVQISLIVTDAQGCMGFDTMNINALPPPTIAGSVTLNAVPVTSGKVYLVYMDGLPQHQYVVDSVTISGGTYSFTNYMDTGNYIVYAMADTALYPQALKTYHDSSFQWQGSPLLNAQCSANMVNVNIYVIEEGTLNGQGSMSGRITEDVGYQRFGWSPGVQTPGDPIPDIDVTLKQNPGGALTTTQTDTGGYYDFSNLPPGVYDVIVDIPGLGQVSQYTRTITSNENFINLDYKVDSTKIFIDPNASTGNLPAVSGRLEVYPVPTRDVVHVEYTLPGPASVTIDVVDVLGNIVHTLASSRQTGGDHAFTFRPKALGITHGIYFIRLNVDGTVQTRRIVTID